MHRLISKNATQARRQGTAATLTAVNGAGYGSDDEVYALADAVDAADPRQEEDQRETKAIEPLPPIDHKNIEYDEFGKDFYEESAETAAMTPADVSFIVLHNNRLGQLVTRDKAGLKK